MHAVMLPNVKSVATESLIDFCLTGLPLVCAANIEHYFFQPLVGNEVN